MTHGRMVGQRTIITLVLAGTVALLSGCAAMPKYSTPTLISLDNHPDCSVIGTWEHYTWSGKCESGWATGYGELKGYSGSSLTYRYIGEMKRGQRHGAGQAWTDGSSLQAGPTTLSGVFYQDRLKDGVRANNRGSWPYTNGKQGDFVPASSSSTGSAAFAVAAGLLSGVAQGAAATGGKNSAQFNALSAALQDTASPSVTGRSPSANVASGAESSSPVNGCAHLVPVLKPAYNDADMFIENSCSYPIVVVVCNVAATSQSCTHQYSEVKPNSRYGLGGGFLPKRVYASFSCKAPFYPNVRLNGGALSGGCSSIPAY